MAKNLIRKTFSASQAWVCPPGVKYVHVFAAYLDYPPIAAGVGHSHAITDSGQMWGWGLNASGVLGLGNASNADSPELVSGSKIWKFLPFGGGCTSSHMVAVDENGDGYAWGQGLAVGDGGKLGIGDTTDRSTPTLILGGQRWRQLTRGSGHTMGLNQACDGYAWGGNSGVFGGVLGTDDNAPRSTPTLIVGGYKWRQLAAGGGASYGIIAESNLLYSWGQNSSGQLGIGNTTTVRSSPSTISATFLDGWVEVYGAGGAAYGIRNNGGAYAWGDNTSGRLGDGTTTNKSTPTLVSGGLLWSRLAPGVNTCVGITRDGDAYAWGDGTEGGLGGGSTTSRSTPTLVSGSKKWRYIASGGSNFSQGLTSQGDRLAWGNNFAGYLGNTSGISRSSPITGSGTQLFQLRRFEREFEFQVVPGQSYVIDIFAQVARFGDETLERLWTGEVTLEYFA